VKAYAELPAMSCSCIYCRNYLAAVETLPEKLLNLYEQFGVDATKDIEVYQLCANEDGTHRYSGFYPVVGRIVAGSHTMGVHQRLTEDFTVCFHTEEALVPPTFPESVFQMEFSGSIVWVLDEDPASAPSG
jgi:hypothetical protein